MYPDFLGIQQLSQHSQLALLNKKKKKQIYQLSEIESSHLVVMTLSNSKTKHHDIHSVRNVQTILASKKPRPHGQSQPLTNAITDRLWKLETLFFMDVLYIVLTSSLFSRKRSNNKQQQKSTDAASAGAGSYIQST